MSIRERIARAVVITAFISVPVGVYLEKEHHVSERAVETGGKVSTAIDDFTYSPRKAVSDAFHGLGTWSDPGPPRR